MGAGLDQGWSLEKNRMTSPSEGAWGGRWRQFKFQHYISSRECWPEVRGLRGRNLNQLRGGLRLRRIPNVPLSETGKA